MENGKDLSDFHFDQLTLASCEIGKHSEYDGTDSPEHELKTEALGVSKAVLADAVRTAGNSAASVREYLKKKK